MMDVITPMDVVSPNDTNNLPDDDPARSKAVLDNTSIANVNAIPAKTVVDPKDIQRATEGVIPPTKLMERLMITHIENINFKSYAGKRVLGPFHKNFTAIVGPNGSGKSNVIDAMLFVFGYRSKKIRSKKLSLLIHNSEGRQNIDSCSVTVHFQKIVDLPGDDFQIIPNSQFNVSRTARVDGSSDYYMNGKRKTFKEIGTVLRGCGIDLDHNRFLILQGEVEQISLMKPKGETEHDDGMLEYLEDIIGTNKYKEPIENTAKEVEELNEKRGEKLNRVKAAEKEKDALKGAKDEAIEVLTIENKIAMNNNLLYQKYIYDCSEIQSKSTEKYNETKKQLDELQEKLKVFIEQKKEKGKEYKKINKLFDKLVEEAEIKKKAFTEMEMYDLKIREELKHRKGNCRKLEKSLETEKNKLEEILKVPEKSKAEIEKCIESIEQLKAQKAMEEDKLNEIMAGLKDETKELQQEKEKKENELMEKQKVVNEAKSKLDVAESELEAYLSSYNKLQEQLQQAKQNAEKASNLREEKLRQVESIAEDLPISKKELERAEKELDEVKRNVDELSLKVKVNRGKWEESKMAMQASQSRNAVIDALMKEKDKGRLPGLHGRLGDLGGIDKKYDIAISTACGPLDFMVVEKMDIAQKAVEFLKRNNVGSTTFIALDKITQWTERAYKQIATPENVKRLYDLVQVKDDTLKIAFYFALKDTLVAETLDQATRIAYSKGSRWRVVTLKGELIETSGTMSGGGSKPAQGRMGCRVIEKVDPAQLERMQQDVNIDLEKLENLRARKSVLEDTVQNLRKRIQKMEPESITLNMEIKSLNAQVAEQQELAKVLSLEVKQASPDPNHEQKMKKTIADFKKCYEKAAEVAGKIEKEVQKMHAKIMEIGKVRVEGQQKKVNSINKIIDEVMQNKTKATVALKTADRNKKKTEEKVLSIEKDIEENNSCIENIEKVELKDLEDKALKCLNEAQEGQDRMKEAQIKLEQVKASFESTNKEEDEMHSKEIDIKHELQKYENAAKENLDKISHWRNRLNNLSLRVIRTSSIVSSKPPEVLPQLTAEEIMEVNDNEIDKDINVLTKKLSELKPNMAAIDEFFEKEELFLFRVKELEEITHERDEKRKEYERLREQRLTEFMAAFGVITSKLKEMYQMITLGGDADLELVDSLDPFSDGVVFSVRPPKKSWKNISNLSGGEKTLSSLSLVFALHHYKPTPLYVMDEIDAALDFKNVSIVANYIKERTKNAQFIIISLRHNMFELADRLVGIYKTDNCTKSTTIKNEF